METLKFELVKTIEQLPHPEKHGIVIAFIPLIGYCSCRYYTGSKKWISNITEKEVFPESWLRLIEIKDEEL